MIICLPQLFIIPYILALDLNINIYILHLLGHSSVAVVAELLWVNIVLVQACVHGHDGLKLCSEVMTGVCCPVFPAKPTTTKST